MNILLTGASGFLGWHLAGTLGSEHRVSATAHHNSPVIPNIEWIPYDLGGQNSMDTLFANVRPDIVVHAAALTSVAYCDAHSREATMVNVKATERIAELCEKQESYLIYASTDLVFDGRRGNYSEDDTTNPVSYYARTKRVAEEVIQSTVARHTIIRFALLYGPPSPHSRSFLGWMGDGFRSGKGVTLFTDQYRTPIFVGDAAELVRNVINRIGTPPQIKLVHGGGPERVSRLEFGQVYCEVFGYDTSLIKAIKMSDKPEVTNDAKDVSLDISKARTFLNYDPCGIRKGLEKTKNSL